MLGMFLDGFDLSIIAVALLPLSSQWHLQDSQSGQLMAMVLLGSFVGALLGGVFIDRHGRRRLLIPNVLLYGLGALWSALSPDLLSLEWGRFLTGLAVGLDYPLVATIVAEYSAAAVRGKGFAWINLAWFGGAIASSLLGWGMLAVLGTDSWRWMLGSALLPTLLLGWLRKDLPESPRWLWRQGKRAQADQALQELHPALTATARSQILERFTGVRIPGTALLLRPWRRRLLLAVLPWFLLDMVSLGIALYLPLVLRSQGWVENDGQAALVNGALLVLSALGILWALPRLDRLGRLPLQLWGFAGMALGLFLFALGADWQSLLAVYLGAAVYAIALGIGPAVTIIALAVELFPTPLRATVGGLATAISRLGAVVSALLFPILDQSVGLVLVLCLAAALALIAGGISWRFGVEARGRELEDLESLPGSGG